MCGKIHRYQREDGEAVHMPIDLRIEWYSYVNEQRRERERNLHLK